LYAAPKYFDKLKPEPAPTRKVWPDIELCTCKKFHSKSFTCITTQNIFDIKSKCARMNWQKVTCFTFNTKRMSNKTRCDVLVKQMFRTRSCQCFGEGGCYFRCDKPCTCNYTCTQTFLLLCSCAYLNSPGNWVFRPKSGFKNKCRAEFGFGFVISGWGRVQASK